MSLIQEEVHRFAISYHRKKRSGSSLSSQLEKIKGIGSKKAGILLKDLGSVKNIENADMDRLAQIKGISKKDAENIFRYFRE